MVSSIVFSQSAFSQSISFTGLDRLAGILDPLVCTLLVDLLGCKVALDPLTVIVIPDPLVGTLVLDPHGAMEPLHPLTRTLTLDVLGRTVVLDTLTHLGTVVLDLLDALTA